MTVPRGCWVPTGVGGHREGGGVGGSFGGAGCPMEVLEGMQGLASTGDGQVEGRGGGTQRGAEPQDR